MFGDEFRPFSSFTTFDDAEGSLASASDVHMMLAQYQRAMATFRSAHMVNVRKSLLDDAALLGTTPVWNTKVRGKTLPTPEQTFEKDRLSAGLTL